MIKTKLNGVNELLTQLRSIGEKVPDTARKQMHRSTDRIVNEAKLNTPRDKGNLEDAIYKDVGYGFRGRLEINVKVAAELNGVNISEYALIVHENYEHMGKGGGPTRPGPGTIAKRQANPDRYIGSKYLERAVLDETSKLGQKLVAAIREVIPK